MIIELHLLQSFPVSNLNRDDMNQPKTATFGGSTRGRISSQSLKRSARLLLTEHGLDHANAGVRTKRLLGEASKVLIGQGRDEQQTPPVVQAGLEVLGFGVDSTTNLTQYLLYVGRQASDLLADFCDRHWDRLQDVVAQKEAQKEKDAKKKPAATDSDTDIEAEDTDSANRRSPAKPKKIKPTPADLKEAHRILDATRVADVALFGRMIADNKDFSVNAASQVAHALSTHAVVNEFDYYTAVDDLKPDGESGADMIGTIDFNSACYYRYCNLDLDQLTDNLDGDTDLAARATRAWLGAFIHAVPSGKQNSMAARTLPATLLGIVRQRGAWNLANAFLTPVSGADLIAESTDRMLRHFEDLRRFYGDTHLLAVAAASVSGSLPHTREQDTAPTLDAFTTKVLDATAR